jgi:hypothetical protein
MIRFLESFGTYSSINQFTSQKWDYVLGTNGPSYAATDGSRGGPCVTLGSANGVQLAKQFGNTSKQKLAIAFRIKGSDMPGSGVRLLNILNDFSASASAGSITPAIALTLDTSGVLGYIGWNVISATSLGTSMLDDNWHWVEMYVDLAGSGATSTLKVYVDGVEKINNTAIDLYVSGGTPTFGDGGDVAFRWLTICGYSSVLSIEDLIIYDDATGGLRASVDFPLGDCAVEYKAVNGAGSSAQWTPSAGDNYAAVDEAVPNGDTDYVTAATAGLVDTYAAADISGSPTIKSVVVGVHFQADGAGLAGVKAHVKSGSSTADGDTQTAMSSYKTRQYEFINDPATSSPWTASGFNAAEIGIKSA